MTDLMTSASSGGVSVIGEGQVVGAGLGVHRLAPCLGGDDLRERLGARQVDDVERCVRGPGIRSMALRRLALGVRGAGQSVVPARDVAAASASAVSGVDDRRRSRSGPGASRRAAPSPGGRGRQPVIGQAEVVDHERLGGGHAPASISSGSSATGSSCWPVMTALSPKSTADSPAVRARNSSQAGERRARAVLGDAGARVVEGQEPWSCRRTRPPRVSWQNRSGCSAVRQPQVGVDVDDAGQDEQPGGVDGSRSPSASRSGPMALDPPVGDGDVGSATRSAVTTVPPGMTDRSRGPGSRQSASSVISMSWAPSHRTRRPISTSCSWPLVTVAKWLPASGRPQLAEAAGAVREEDLALADLAGVDEQLPGRRVALWFS